jgi:hypothetical protein
MKNTRNFTCTIISHVVIMFVSNYNYIPIQRTINQHLIPVLQFFLIQELTPPISTKIGDGHRLVDHHIMQCVHLYGIHIGTQSQILAVCILMVDYRFNGTRDSL